MISNLLALKYIFLGCLFFFIAGIYIAKIQNYMYPFTSKEILLKDKHLYLIFLDQFYIKNKSFTIICFSLYIILNFLIFVFFRYLVTGQILSIPQVGNHSLNIWGILYFILFYLAVMLLLILYRIFLNILFKKEINKFLIYFSSFDTLFENFVDFIKLDVLDRILGILREFFYRTSTQTYRENLFPFSNHPDLVDDEGKDPDWISLDDEYHYQVKNKYLIVLAYATQNFLKAHKKIKKLFKFISRLLRFLHVHAYILKYYFPHFLIIVSFIYDIYNREIKITYIALFIWLIVKLQRDLTLFIEYKSYYPLNEYFYNNEMPYEKQREFLYNYSNITIVKTSNSEQNSKILEYETRKNLLKEIFDDDFGWKLKKSKRMRFPDTMKAKGMYRRVYVIFIFFLIYLYLYLQNIYAISSPLIISLIIIFIFIFIIFAHYKTYHITEYDECYEHSTFKYNRKYNVIFWIIAIIQIYFFWSVIFYPQLMILQNETLFNYNFLTISKIFTQEEKILYLYQYFDYYNILPELAQDYLRYIIRRIDFHLLIDESITLKDIQVYIKLLNDNYIYNEFFNNNLEYQMNEDLKKSLMQKTCNLLGSYDPNSLRTNFYNFGKGILIAGAITTVVGSSVYFWFVFKQINNTYSMAIIANQILKNYFKASYHASNQNMSNINKPSFYSKILFESIKDVFVKISKYFYGD